MYFIASVWLINGLFFKILQLTPRHENIVGRILGEKYSAELTIGIGVSELLMVVWILSGYMSRLNAITQIVIVLFMNVLEFFLSPDLLLFGRFNILFALGFVTLIYLNEFVLKKPQRKIS